MERRDHPYELRGHPILCRRVNRPFLMTRSKALVRSIQAMYRGLLCLRHLSYSCLNEKITSIVDLPALSPNCVSGYTRSDNVCNPFTATWAKAFPPSASTSSETQGQSVGPGEKARRKFSSTGGRALGYRLSPDHFQTVKRMLAPDWAQKCFVLLCPIGEQFSSVLVVSSYTCPACHLHFQTCQAAFIE